MPEATVFGLNRRSTICAKTLIAYLTEKGFVQSARARSVRIETTRTLYLPTAEFEAPAGKTRPVAKPETFMVLVVTH